MLFPQNPYSPYSQGSPAFSPSAGGLGRLRPPQATSRTYGPPLRPPSMLGFRPDRYTNPAPPLASIPPFLGSPDRYTFAAPPPPLPPPNAGLNDGLGFGLPIPGIPSNPNNDLSRYMTFNPLRPGY